MPIRGRSLGGASRAFTNHLNRVLAVTVSQRPLAFEIFNDAGGTGANIRYRNGSESNAALIQTTYGPVGLYIGQICDSLVVGNEHILRTLQYRYMLIPEGHREPLLRWEYIRFPGEEEVYCRHQVQGPISLDLYDDQNNQVKLSDLHLPTGWVPVAEVLRFCLVDLGVKPLSSDWDRVLRESERLSRAEFATMDEL
jgi:hypothetical protein